ncbi:MAG: F0F1 ATP synthase subunit B [Tardiphaga sp.]|jgi:F-type H+-transporting ATPase subunit b
MFVTSAHAQEAAPAQGETHAPAAEPAPNAAPAPAEGHAAPAEGAPADAHAAPGADGHTTGTEAEHGGGVFPPFDSTNYPSQLLWLAITFGLFYLFLKKVVLPRIAHILETRSDRIAQDLDQAARSQGDADAAVAAYEQELAEAKAKANAIGQTARDTAKADAETLRKKIEAGLDAKLADAEAHISSIKSKAMAEVGSIAESTAAAIIEQLTGGKADKAAITAAVKASRS